MASHGSTALGSFKYTTAFVVQIFPLEWFINIIDERMKLLIGEFTDFLNSRGVPDNDIPKLKDDPKLFPVNFSYEIEYYNTLQRDANKIKELLDEVKESYSEPPEYRSSEFESYDGADWIPATSAFTINTVLLSCIITEVQGIISGIPC